MGLFDLQPTVTLFDLTNTFFEGAASRQPKAQRGHSKDKRSPSLTQERAIGGILPPFWPKITCKLLTLGRRS